ncbi:MAG: hypothetical protein AUG48_07130 [Actinobacteria bacterium 13_1_20CM_3_68_9]|nr:MAG: hypothetical protein AUG48_07130 [Actinobacteria bacterium 13_1_20CM_3_68_9]
MAAVVRVLIEDPDLAHGIAGERRRAAERACLANVVRATRGPWRADRVSSAPPGSFGLLVLKGLLSRRVGRGGRFGAELLGPGDLLRPWDRPGDQAAMSFATDWKVIQPARLAILDRRFAERAAPYPEIADQLIGRTLLRSRQLTETMAIVHHPRVEVRVHALLWSLAERWGTVRRDGIALSLPLTHALLADMVAASRPAVTAALSALTKRRCVLRDRDLWLLRGGPPAELDEVGGTALAGS